MQRDTGYKWHNYNPTVRIKSICEFEWHLQASTLLTSEKVIYEPCHDKTNIVRLRPALIQTSLRIRAVWSGSMLFAISFSTCNRVVKRTAWILIRLCGCAGWSGSMLVANQLCWFCRYVAHIVRLVAIFFDLIVQKKNRPYSFPQIYFMVLRKNTII
jgi:hypothetical protein